MKAEVWLAAQEFKYKLDIEEQLGDNQFISRIWTIKDPLEKGFSLKFSSNVEGQASIVYRIGPFAFGRFTIAEGFSSEFLLKSIEKVLKGDIPIEHTILGFPRLVFHDSETNISAIGKISPMTYLKHRFSIKTMLSNIQSYQNK